MLVQRTIIMEESRWVCRRNGMSWHRGNGPKKGVGFRGTDFIFSSFRRDTISRVCPNNWTLLLVVREEFRCTPWLVVGLEPQGCHWSGTSKDLRRVCVCSLFLYFDPSIVVLFFGGFSVHTFVAHGVANELQRGSVHEGSSLNQRWSPVCRVVVRVGVAHCERKGLTMNKEG